MPLSCSVEAVQSGRNAQTAPQDRVYRGLLLDFFGELLSARQRECCELYYNDDLSLSEIAETCGISRQGAWDNIRRGAEALEEIENKTGLLHRHVKNAEHLKQLEGKLQQLEERCRGYPELSKLVQDARKEVSALLRTED